MRKPTASAGDEPPWLVFDGFRFNPESRELFRATEKIPLAPKPAQLLQMLLERPGRILRREEVVAALWPHEIVTFDKSLNFTILQLRRRLGDDPRQPRFIETIPRVGFRFVADVRPEPGSGEGLPLEPGRGASGFAATKRLARFSAAAGFLLLVALIAGAAGWRHVTPGARTSEGRLLHVRALDLLHAADRARDRRLELVGRAVDHLERAAAIEPANGALWLDLANAYFRLPLDPDRLRRASRAADRAVALDPDAPGAHLRQGDVRSLLEWDWAGARASYETALALDPLFAEAHRHLATSYLLHGRDEQAIAHIQRALALEPLSSVLHGEAGWTYCMQGTIGPRSPRATRPWRSTPPPGTRDSARFTRACGRETRRAPRARCRTCSGIGRLPADRRRSWPSTASRSHAWEPAPRTGWIVR